MQPARGTASRRMAAPWTVAGGQEGGDSGDTPAFPLPRCAPWLSCRSHSQGRGTGWPSPAPCQEQTPPSLSNCPVAFRHHRLARWESCGTVLGMPRAGEPGGAACRERCLQWGWPRAHRAALPKPGMEGARAPWPGSGGCLSSEGRQPPPKSGLRSTLQLPHHSPHCSAPVPHTSRAPCLCRLRRLLRTDMLTVCESPALGSGVFLRLLILQPASQMLM